ncbi:MAG: FAD binding domain-containing protein [Chitinophagaceae bacterium]|nr:FAD binding domain-containing protein [Chitinophagaceae bacterium]
MIRFILNNQLVETGLARGSTVLDYVRYHKRLAGTKIGCREGDCGACTLLVGDFENEKLVYRSVTSCLMPLGNANGKHIVSVEGINMPLQKPGTKILSPVQQAMVDTNGTQCGFCTLGFVMSFTGFVLAKTKKYDEAIAAIDGNICRCTGYKSIERAAQIITEKINAKPSENTIEWLVQNNFIPVYFLNIKYRLQQLKNEIAAILPIGNNKMMVGGGTDVMVQKPQAAKKSAIDHLSDNTILKGITVENGQCYIGASVTVTEFAASALVQGFFPDLAKYIKLVSSTPIRNMATLAGNLVNASPIGDMTIFFLALDADIVLNKNNNPRTVKLKNFYKGYKLLDKEPGEIIEKIIFTPPSANSLFNFEKVSKRMHLDIASVNCACQIQMNEDGTIADIHLSAGGVAPFPKYLTGSCNFLKGKKLDKETLPQAVPIINEEVSPISDARGTAEYKRLLLRQLFIAHCIQFFGPAVAQDVLTQMKR